jgi:hypothetical protein
MPNVFSLLRDNRPCRALFTTVWTMISMWTMRNMKLLTRSTTTLSMWMGASSNLTFHVVHDQLLCLADVEGEADVLVPHWQVSDLLPISSPSVIKSTTVVSLANIMMGLESCASTQSRVNREYRRGVSTHPWGTPCWGSAWRVCCCLPSPPGGGLSGSPGCRGRVQSQGP